MNTANLQLEGLLLALAHLIDIMKRKQLLTEQEIEEALASAEDGFSRDVQRKVTVSSSQLEAVLFPIRFLRLTLQAKDDLWTFTEITKAVGEGKPDVSL